jgi:hypothetical protein
LSLSVSFSAAQLCLRILFKSPGRLRSTFEFCWFIHSATQSYDCIGVVVNYPFYCQQSSDEQSLSRNLTFFADIYPDLQARIFFWVLCPSPPIRSGNDPCCRFEGWTGATCFLHLNSPTSSYPLALAPTCTPTFSYLLFWTYCSCHLAFAREISTSISFGFLEQTALCLVERIPDYS